MLEIVKCLSDTNRLKILKLLFQNNKELCACDLIEQLQMTQSNLSKHMSKIISASLVNTRKEGKWSFYSLNQKTLAHYTFIAILLSEIDFMEEDNDL